MSDSVRQRGDFAYSGEIMLATDAATIHVDMTQSFLVYPIVVVPAQERPSRYDGLNVEICVPTTRAILFDHGAAIYHKVSGPCTKRQAFRSPYHDDAPHKAGNVRYGTGISDAELCLVKHSRGD